MPYADIADLHRRRFKLYYERHGHGEPLLLIRGLGRSSRFWGPVVDALADECEVILMDNRGIGRSEAPLSLYTTADLARDCVALLDHLGLERAHVFGMSLGGMIAQEVGLRHASRVGRLILGCTTPGRHGVKPPPEMVKTLARTATMSLDEKNLTMARAILSPGFLASHPEVLDRWRGYFLAEPVRKRDLLRQMVASGTHDTWDRLPHLKPRTLLISGDSDLLIPPRNSELMAARIPGASLEWLPGAGHDFTTERPDESTELVLDFIQRG